MFESAMQFAIRHVETLWVLVFDSLRSKAAKMLCTSTDFLKIWKLIYLMLCVRFAHYIAWYPIRSSIQVHLTVKYVVINKHHSICLNVLYIKFTLNMQICRGSYFTIPSTGVYSPTRIQVLYVAFSQRGNPNSNVCCNYQCVLVLESIKDKWMRCFI